MGVEWGGDSQSLTRREKVTLGVLAGVAVVGAACLALSSIEQSQDAREAELEVCVSDRVGYEVNLERHPGSDRLMRPAVILNDIVACERVGDNAALTVTNP